MAEEHIPRHGDEVEAWLERWQATLVDNERVPGFHLIAGMLDDYRLHAISGVPLSDEVER